MKIIFGKKEQMCKKAKLLTCYKLAKSTICDAMADALDSGSSGATHAGSSPVTCTKFCLN